MRLTFLITVLPIVFSARVFSQEMNTAFLRVARKNTIALYQKTIGAQARLYNGSKYVAPEYDPDEHPFFLSFDWLTGNVFYDGEWFSDVPLMLDLQAEQLITEHYSNGQPLQLVKEKIRHFDISGHHFERIENVSVASSLPETGFYDILYNGPTRVIARRQKLLHEEIISSTIETSFEEKTRYFIFKNGSFHPVKSRHSVLKLLADKKQQLKKGGRRKRTVFKENREAVYKEIAARYDALPAK